MLVPDHTVFHIVHDVIEKCQGPTWLSPLAAQGKGQRDYGIGHDVPSSRVPSSFQCDRRWQTAKPNWEENYWSPQLPPRGPRCQRASRPPLTLGAERANGDGRERARLRSCRRLFTVERPAARSQCFSTEGRRRITDGNLMCVALAQESG
ncbi:hypothetical protein Q5P01_025002 [Channa striata]|uniref:Uncharacterized protein n=1 Tax=Channa striata TaxID=64152 RepID=A0AA88LL53_CHASR|nr:hypothetical protein Q5P01_025002 [Channa striata]